MSNIAQNILAKCGGARKVADWLGLDPSTVFRWTYEKEGGRGTGGLIPSEHQAALLRKANENDIALSPADFFPRDEAAA